MEQTKMFVQVNTYLFGILKNHFSFRPVDKTEFCDESRRGFNVHERGCDRCRAEWRNVFDSFGYRKGPWNHERGFRML